VTEKKSFLGALNDINKKYPTDATVLMNQAVPNTQSMVWNEAPAPA
jgi:hypothetical protein